MQPHARPVPADLCVVLDGRRKVVCLDCNVNLRRHGRDVFVDHGGRIDEWCETRPVRVVAVEPVAVVVEPVTPAVPAVAVEPATEPATEPSQSLSADEVALLLAVRTDATPTTQESPMPNRPTAPDTLPNGVRLDIPPGVGGIADIVAANHPAPAMPAPVAEAREAAVVCAACRRAANTMKGRICATCQSRAHTLWGTWTPTDEQISALPKAWAVRAEGPPKKAPRPAVAAVGLTPPESLPKVADVRVGPKMGDGRRVVELRTEVNRLTAALEASNARNLATIESVGRLERERDGALVNDCPRCVERATDKPGRLARRQALDRLLGLPDGCGLSESDRLARVARIEEIVRERDRASGREAELVARANASAADLTTAVRGAEWLMEEVLLQTGATRDEVLDCMNAEGHRPVVNRAAGREHSDLAAIDEALSLSGEGRTRYEGDRVEVVKHLLSELAATGRTLDHTRAASQHGLAVMEEANRDLLVEFKATHKALERAGYAPNSYSSGMPDAVAGLEESRNRFRERCDEATARADGEASRANAMHDELDAIDKVWGWTDPAAEPPMWRAQKIGARLDSDATTIAALQRNCDEMAASLRAALAEVNSIDAAMGWTRPAVAPGWRAEKITETIQHFKTMWRDAAKDRDALHNATIEPGPMVRVGDFHPVVETNNRRAIRHLLGDLRDYMVAEAHEDGLKANVEAVAILLGLDLDPVPAKS